MVKEAIVLAGGAGTRLRSVVADVPKPLADINGTPFLEYLLRYLERQGINTVVIAVSYMADAIMDYCRRRRGSLQIRYSVEAAPLGTGGAIKQALTHTAFAADDVFICNGDTFFDVSLSELWQVHSVHQADVTIALRRETDSRRFGSVICDPHTGRIVRFTEKGERSGGLINGGVYVVKKQRLSAFDGDVFSFEYDFLTHCCRDYLVMGKEFFGYFIDIGIPSDLYRAQDQWRNME
ncbi:MAG: nucleotidyltransferase family protein [Candidatus Omnitrophica bacterium]|nr:nucleotidyltransferase family protein [Candidatus Omnitrophota bacterium]